MAITDAKNDCKTTLLLEKIELDVEIPDEAFSETDLNWAGALMGAAPAGG